MAILPNEYMKQLEASGDVEHIHGRGKTAPHGEHYGPIVEAFILSNHIGKYLIMAGTGPFASKPCRCPALSADVFRKRETAEKTLELITLLSQAKGVPNECTQQYEVEEITPVFINWYAHRLDPLSIAKRLHDQSQS